MIQPQCTKIFKVRSNSSNMFKGINTILENSTNLQKEGEKQEARSAQRSLANSRQEETSEQASIIKVIKLSTGSDKRWNCINSFQTPTNKGILLLPSTNKVYRNIKRIEFSRRMNMMDKPIVIIKFEGIVGEIHKERIWSDKNFKLITRGSAVDGLKLFSAYFQVVLFIQKSTKNTQKIKEWTKAKWLVLDAIYSKKKENGSIAEDFAQIYNDFNVVNPKSIAKSVIVISWVNIDSWSLKNNIEFEQSLFDKTQGMICTGFPYTINCRPDIEEVPNKVSETNQVSNKSKLDMPLTMLFPHILTEGGDDLSMISIFKTVITVALLSLKEYSVSLKHINLNFLKESDVKFQKQFLGLDVTRVCERFSSCDALLFEPIWDEEVSTTILSDSETKKMPFRKKRFKKSINNSFDLNLVNKIASSDEDTSDHDSWSSAKTDQNIGQKHVSFSVQSHKSQIYQILLYSL